MTEVRPGGGDPLPAPRCPLPRLDRLTSREGKEGRRGEQTHRAYVTEADEPHTSLREPCPEALSHQTPNQVSAPHSGGFFGESLAPQGTGLPCAALVLRGPPGSG